MDVYKYIEASRSDYPITELCSAFGVSESGFHAHRKRPLCKRRIVGQVLAKRVEAIHVDSRNTYGSPRIHDALADEGIRIGRNRVCRLMRERGIDARPRKKRVHTTDSKHRLGVAKNLLNRAFTTVQPNTVWVGDITYVETKQGWLYLATVIDLYARKVVGYALDKTMPDGLVLKALNRALAIRDTPAEFMFHSDRGSQYASKSFKACLKDNGIVLIQPPKRSPFPTGVR